MLLLNEVDKQDFVFKSSDVMYRENLSSIEYSNKLFYGEFQVLPKEIGFQYHQGRYLRDLLSGSMPCLKLVSSKFKSVVEANNLTGIKFNPVVLKGKDKNEIPGYFLASFTGRCLGLKPNVFSEEKIIFGPAKVECSIRKNFEFDFENWDGNDFCVAPNKWFVFVSPRVKEVFEKEKLSLEFVAVSDFYIFV